MSDFTPTAEEREVDPDLMRRVAWGMIAGKSKAEIAEAEGISAEECEIVCTAPGMFSILDVWVNFLERRKAAGRRNARKLTGWCVDHVFRHAPERLAESEIWRLDRLASVMLHYGFAIVFGWMLGFLDGVLCVPGAKRRDLGDFKQNLVDLLCWAIEVTFREKMLEQFSVELLIAKDGAFQAAIAGREFFELGIGIALQAIEKPAVESSAAENSESSSANSTIAESNRAKGSWRRRPLSAPTALPRRSSSGRPRVVSRTKSMARPPGRSTLLAPPIRRPPRPVARRGRPPPLDRLRPSGQAALLEHPRLSIHST